MNIVNDSYDAINAQIQIRGQLEKQIQEKDIIIKEKDIIINRLTAELETTKREFVKQRDAPVTINPTLQQGGQ